jgi:hypothetical protein
LDSAIRRTHHTGILRTPRCPQGIYAGVLRITSGCPPRVPAIHTRQLVGFSESGSKVVPRSARSSKVSKGRHGNFLRIFLRYPQKCQKPQKPLLPDMMTGCLARSIDIPCERSSFQALTAHCGNRSRHPLRTRRIVLEKYLSNSVSRLCPTDSLFVGHSVINTPLSSKFLKREPSRGPEAQTLLN